MDGLAEFESTKVSGYLPVAPEGCVQAAIQVVAGQGEIA